MTLRSLFDTIVNDELVRFVWVEVTGEERKVTELGDWLDREVVTVAPFVTGELIIEVEGDDE